jgi:methanethiol S-methyltransferase
MEFTPQIVVGVVLWILWCFFHSFLIAAPVTGYMKKKLKGGYPFYRLLYNIVAAATLLPLYLYSISIETTPVFRWEGALTIIRYVLVSAAVCLFSAGARHYSLSRIVGIDQIRILGQLRRI